MSVKVILLSGISAFTVLAQSAQAQTTDPSQPSEESVERSDRGIQEIIVTAQRREQRLQDVPITISAIGESTLDNAGVTGMTQLQAVAPSLQINQSFGPANIFMRGVGFKSGDLLAETSVAVYVDGVYQANAVANIFEFNGVERVEVLKGPQGTLFGRNATGGVVQVITKNPSFDPQMKFDVGYANYDTVSASAYVSSGLTDNIAANLAVQYQDQGDGWGRNITTGEERFYSRDFSARGKLLLTPSDATEVVLSGNYTDFDRQDLDPQNPPGAVLATGQGFLGRYQVAGDSNTEATGESYGGSLTITHDFGGMQIRNIAAYQKVTIFQGLDQDASALPLVRGDFYFRSRMISEEFHVLAPSDAKFQWLAGVYYFNFNGYSDPVDITGLVFDPTFSDPTLGVAVYGKTATRSISGFAQGTYPLTDRMNLTAGIRYTKDKVTYTGSVNAAGTPFVLQPEQTKKYSDESPTWRLSLDYKFTPDVMGYVSYNRGVKSGGFSLGTVVAVNEAFDTEKIDAFEVGLKTQLFESAVNFNTAAFYYDFQNIQFQRVVAGSVFTINGPSAKIYGAEAELNGRVTPNLTLRANGAYLHTRIGDFPNAPNVNRLPNGRNDFGDPNFNAKGNRLPYAPKWTGNVGFEYRLPMNSGDVTLSSNLSYNGKSFSELDNRQVRGSYEMLSASLGWEGNNGLRLSVWGNNLTNSYFYTNLVAVGGGNDFAVPTAPRTYGVTFGYDF